MTLIEVVAALVLLATTVTALLAAQGASLEQLRATRNQEKATDIARELLAHWELEDADLHTAAQQHIDSETQWRWTRTARPIPTRSRQLWEVTLTVHHMGEAATEQQVGKWTWLERIDEAGDKP